MQRKLARRDALFLATLFDQSFGEFGAFPHGYHPAGDIAAKNIQDHVEVEIGPLHGSEQLGNVPTPELIGSRGQQFWFFVGRMRQLIATLAGLPALLEQTIHAADGTEIFSFIEKGRIRSAWRAILEAFLVQTSQDRFAFRGTECACRYRPRHGLLRKRSLTTIPIVRSARHAQSLASSAGADLTG